MYRTWLHCIHSTVSIPSKISSVNPAQMKVFTHLISSKIWEFSCCFSLRLFPSFDLLSLCIIANKNKQLSHNAFCYRKQLNRGLEPGPNHPQKTKSATKISLVLPQTGSQLERIIKPTHYMKIASGRQVYKVSAILLGRLHLNKA